MSEFWINYSIPVYYAVGTGIEYATLTCTRKHLNVHAVADLEISKGVPFSKLRASKKERPQQFIVRHLMC